MGDDPSIPELLIHLDCKPETALKRVMQRGRTSEKNALNLNYLRALKKTYEEFLGKMRQSGSRVLRLDWERFMSMDEVLRRVRPLISN